MTGEADPQPLTPNRLAPRRELASYQSINPPSLPCYSRLRVDQGSPGDHTDTKLCAERIIGPVDDALASKAWQE
jgi:hypothetical protein